LDGTFREYRDPTRGWFFVARKILLFVKSEGEEELA